MPRGGKRLSDDYSPYKHPDGRELKLLKSSKSLTGYFCIVEKHPGKFYPKKKLDAVTNSKLQKCFGEGKPSAREAAIALADFLDKPHELPKAPPRAPPGSRLTEQQREAKRQQRLGELSNEVCSLLGIPTELSEEEKAEIDAQAAEFAAWRAAPQPVAFAGPVLVLGEEPPAAAPEPPQWASAHVLEQVARIKAAAPVRV